MATGKVLLVDDDSSDAELVRMSITRKNIDVRLKHVDRGTLALDLLNGRGQYSEEILPDLILLDLKMPVMDGFEVLESMQESSVLRVIPVIVWTSSESQRDIDRAYQLGANAYLSKPDDPFEFFDVVECTIRYWLEWCKSPQVKH